MKGFARILILSPLIVATLFGCEKSSLNLPTELTEFSPSIEVLTPAIDNDSDFSFKIFSDRKVRIDGYTCEFEAENFAVGDEIEMDFGGSHTVTCPKVSIESDHTGTVSVALYDEVSGNTVELSASFMAYAHRIVYPGGITFSKDTLSVSYYDETEPDSGIESFQVSMTPEDAETGFKVEVESGGMGRISISTSKDGVYSQSCTIEDNKGMVYVKGGDMGGPVTIKVSATANPALFAYVHVYVRHRVALMVYGSFENKMWDPGHTNGMEPGWYGVPTDIKCRFVTWEVSGNDGKTIDKISADNLDGLLLQNFTKLTGNYSASFRVSVSPDSRTYEQFYGPNGGDVAHLVVNKNEQISATLPAKSQQVYSVSAMPYNGEKSLTSVCTALSAINDNTYWVGYWWFLNIRGYRHETEWTSVALTVDSINYDKDRLDLRYCLYMFSTQYSSGRYCGTDVYWWADVDHIPWLQKWES